MAIALWGRLSPNQLKKFAATHIESEEQRWLKFFTEGEQLNDDTLPEWMITQEMKQAMSTLSTFSEKDQNYFKYQARQEYIREQNAIQNELEQAKRESAQAKRLIEAAKKREEALQQRETIALQEKQAAIHEKQDAMQKTQAALAEIEQLKALLAKKEQ